MAQPVETSLGRKIARRAATCWVFFFLDVGLLNPVYEVFELSGGGGRNYSVDAKGQIGLMLAAPLAFLIASIYSRRSQNWPAVRHVFGVLGALGVCMLLRAIYSAVILRRFSF